MTEEQKVTESEFLSILVLEPKIGFDLLQIKPNYLQDRSNQLLMKAIIEVYKRDGIISIPNLVDYDKSVSVDKIADVICSDYLPIIDTRKYFMSCQVIILNNHKKRIINNLIEKLNNKEITIDEYLKKMSVISEINIKVDSEVISEMEILENISTENTRIELKSFSSLNKMLKLVQNDFLMIGASTGVGKSGLLLNLMNDLMEDYQCIYFNMEMSKSTIYKRIISINSNIPISYVEKPESEYQKELIKKSIDEVVRNKIVVEHKATYLHEIRNVLKLLKNDNKHTIIFLDHVGLIKSTGVKSQYEQMTEVAKQLRQLCLDYDCTIIAACQLNRASYNSEELNLSMLKDSGELENSSSKVILLYRDKEDKKKNENSLNAKMILEIVKNREGQLGKIQCNYDKTKQIFKEEWS